MISLTVVLSGSGGVLDRQELHFDDGRWIEADVNEAIRMVIAEWNLRPGDKIEILGNEKAFEVL